MNIILQVLWNALGLLLIAEFFRGVSIDGLFPAIIGAVVLGVLNAVVRPILFILTLPITIITLGLFSFVINALLFWFAAEILDGFTVDSFWWALFGSVAMSIIATIGANLIKKR